MVGYEEQPVDRKEGWEREPLEGQHGQDEEGYSDMLRNWGTEPQEKHKDEVRGVESSGPC